MNDSVCDAYCLKLGDMRKSLTETGWHSLPVQKGKFYNHSSLKENHRHSPEKGKSRRRVVQTVEQIEQLPQEQDTAQVLDIIFPKTPLSHDVPVASVANGETPHSDSSKCFKSEPAKPIKVSQLKRKSDDSGGQKFYNKGGWCGQIINPASSGSGGSVCASSGALVAGASISLGVDGRYLVNGPTAMLQFRKWLLDKFPTPKDAYDSFANEFPAGRDLTKKEWRRILGRQGFEWLPVADSDAIFEQIDFGHEKRISLRALIMAVEAAAPIRTLQDLRRRWLASGFRSMNQAVNKMAEHMSVQGNRLTLLEFGDALKDVNVLDGEEHLALFSAVCSDPSGKTSIDELTSAIAMVSPALLLEDLRDRLLTRYSNDVKKAFFDMDLDHGGKIDRDEFLEQSCRRLNLTDIEAKKAFREIDIDASKTISRAEFISALGLSEPSLFLETIRLKFRQRFRSIQSRFAEMVGDNETEELNAQAPKLTLAQFH